MIASIGSSRMDHVEHQIRLGEKKEISIQELSELGLPTRVAAPLFSIHKLEGVNGLINMVATARGNVRSSRGVMSIEITREEIIVIS